MNKQLSVTGFSILFTAIALIGMGSQKAMPSASFTIASNRMQDAISEAKASAAQCQSSDSCSDCVEEVISSIIRKYRLESRREISAVSDAARENCD